MFLSRFKHNFISISIFFKRKKNFFKFLIQLLLVNSTSSFFIAKLLTQTQTKSLTWQMLQHPTMLSFFRGNLSMVFLMINDICIWYLYENLPLKIKKKLVILKFYTSTQD
jgi:hypothetical protein